MLDVSLFEQKKLDNRSAHFNEAIKCWSPEVYRSERSTLSVLQNSNSAESSNGNGNTGNVSVSYHCREYAIVENGLSHRAVMVCSSSPLEQNDKELVGDR